MGMKAVSDYEHFFSKNSCQTFCRDFFSSSSYSLLLIKKIYFFFFQCQKQTLYILGGIMEENTRKKKKPEDRGWRTFGFSGLLSASEGEMEKEKWRTQTQDPFLLFQQKEQWPVQIEGGEGKGCSLSSPNPTKDKVRSGLCKQWATLVLTWVRYTDTLISHVSWLPSQYCHLFPKQVSHCYSRISKSSHHPENSHYASLS